MATRRRARGRWWRWVGWSGLAAIGLLIVAIAGSYAADGPLRRVLVREMNQRLKGYSAVLGGARFHPVGLSLTLYDLAFVQEAHPDPPVFRVRRLDASVNWRALLHGRLVAAFVFADPAVYVNLQQLRAEAADPTPLDQHGWQEAFEAIYPLKINEVDISNGTVTYVDDGPFKPLEISHLAVRAQNIRNIRSKERTYPSDVHLEAAVFESGRIVVDGHADFLAEPIPGLQGDVTLEGVELDYFKPVLNHGSMAIQGGVLAAAGAFEWGPTVRIADLRRASISGMNVEYVETSQTVGAPRRAAGQVGKAAQQANNAPDLALRAHEVEIVDSRVGFRNTRTSPSYRAFLDVTRLRLENFTNHATEGQMTATLAGRFMGNGPTRIAAHFRPEVDGPDFDMRIEIDATDLRTMNDMLRAYGGFDVVAGVFTFYSELAVKNGQVRGYVKPLFRDVQAYDPTQDRNKSAARKLYEHVVTGVAKIMKNMPRKEVVTKVDISGPLDDPKGSTTQAILKLIQNAFFRAILPGFDREAHEAG